MIEIAYKRITKPQQLGPQYTDKDGLGLFDGHEYLVHDCIIDMSEADNVDEAAAVTWGCSAEFHRCVIRDAGKLFLCGSGDKDKRSVEDGKTVTLESCILENFGRRGPEVQCGMQVTMRDCLIRNWGSTDYFDVRSFGAWTHDGGSITAVNCIFIQENPIFSKNFFADLVSHVGQAVNDDGLLALLNPSTYVPGICRGLTATRDGKVSALGCYKNRWWVRVEGSKGRMSEGGAEELEEWLEGIREKLEERI